MGGGWDLTSILWRGALVRLSEALLPLTARNGSLVTISPEAGYCGRRFSDVAWQETKSRA